MSEAILPYGRQWIDEDDIAAVVECLRGDWLTQGPTVKRFEDALAEITGAPYVVAVANGTAALHLAALAAGVGAGDVGITSDVTFVASANCIRYAGGEADVVDVEADTGLLAIDALERAVAKHRTAGRRVRAVIPVSFSGSVPDLERVREIAGDAVVIEDAAHSLGATYRDRSGHEHRSASCAHTAMAILSFHPVKHLTTGEGGAITTRDEALYRELLMLRSHGLTKDPALLSRNDGPWYQEQQMLGFNYRITDLQCALGVAQTRKFPAMLARRRELAARYDAAFAREPLQSNVIPLAVPGTTTSAYHLYVLRLRRMNGETLEGLADRRRVLFEGLMELGIRPQVHYPPVHRQPDYASRIDDPARFPGSDALYASCLSLPLFPRMSDGDVDRVVDAIARVLRA